uniref:Isoform 2 of Oxidation resistance protein 1 n=1 Tax=Rattus norvegicus TaxID=10116 RepID=Q4V8B0-2|nr:Oxr1 protein [Rattus norvegicus]
MEKAYTLIVFFLLLRLSFILCGFPEATCFWRINHNEHLESNMRKDCGFILFTIPVHLVEDHFRVLLDFPFPLRCAVCLAILVSRNRILKEKQTAVLIVSDVLPMRFPTPQVVSVAEYHRRIDALNTEELRTLCRRLQITTREDINSKQAAPAKADLEPESFRPNLSDPSELLLPDQIEKLTKHLPPRTIGYPWTLVYGTGKHGTSLKTLYRTMTGLDTPVLMVIKDSDGQVFGALASEPFKVSDGFYGTGETFVFTFCPEFEVFKWTGDNMFFIKGDMDSLAFGGGGGEFALWLDGDLYHGRSHSCKTFGNHTLSKKEDFFIQDIEIWAFE